MTIFIESMQKLITKMQSNFYTNYNQPWLHLNQAEIKTLTLCMFYSFMGALCFFMLPELSYAVDGGGISNITNLKSLTKTVKTDIQSYGIPIVLNAAGIGLSGFALLTQRWTYLFFGAAYLIFVNLYFGFVNGNFNVQ
jgi:hypothetical protein